MSFQVGDVVVLKSGGPEMTVEAVNSEGKIWCVWFPMGKPFEEVKHGMFQPATLVKPEPLV